MLFNFLITLKFAGVSDVINFMSLCTFPTHNQGWVSYWQAIAQNSLVYDFPAVIFSRKWGTWIRNIFPIRNMARGVREIEPLRREKKGSKLRRETRGKKKQTNKQKATKPKRNKESKMGKGREAYEHRKNWFLKIRIKRSLRENTTQCKRMTHEN